MSDTSWSPSNPLPAGTYDNLELAKEAAHAYAWGNGFAIAVLRSAKWGHPPATRKVWMRCVQGGHHRTRPSEEPDLRQRSTKRAGCAYVPVYLLLKNEKWTMTHNISCTTAPYSHRLAQFHLTGVGGIAISSGHSLGDHVFQSCWGSQAA